MNVLIVEDSKAIAEILRWTLEYEGHHTLVMDEGMRGLLDPAHPAWIDTDVLVSDLIMPDVSGLAIAAVCRQSRPNIKRICLTGVGDDNELLVEAKEMFDVVFPKPTAFGALLSAIGEAHGSD